LNTAGALLLATAAAKIWSSFGHATMLVIPDPILGLGFRKLMLAVGGTELLVALFCFLPWAKPWLKLALVTWLAANFLVYRMGLWFIGWHHPCRCLGNLAGALRLSDQAADNLMKPLQECSGSFSLSGIKVQSTQMEEDV